MTLYEFGINKFYTTPDGYKFHSSREAINHMRNNTMRARMIERDRKIAEKNAEQESILKQKLTELFENNENVIPEFIELIVKNKEQIKRSLRGIKIIKRNY